MFRIIFTLLISTVLCFAACDPQIGCPDQRSGNFADTQGRIRYEVETPGGILVVRIQCNQPRLLIYHRCGRCATFDDCPLARGGNEVRAYLPAGFYRIEGYGNGNYYLTTSCPPLIPK